MLVYKVKHKSSSPTALASVNMADQAKRFSSPGRRMSVSPNKGKQSFTLSQMINSTTGSSQGLRRPTFGTRKSVTTPRKSTIATPKHDSTGKKQSIFFSDDV